MQSPAWAIAAAAVLMALPVGWGLGVCRRLFDRGLLLASQARRANDLQRQPPRAQRAAFNGDVVAVVALKLLTSFVMSVHRRHRLPVSLIAWALVLMIPCHATRAAPWESIPTFSGLIDIELDTLGPSGRIAGATGVWVRYTPTLSVDCSPPRGCYANTQRIYYNFNCRPRYAVAMERISMDLKGAVIKHEIFAIYVTSNDEAAHRVLNAFCGLPDRDDGLIRLR